MPFISALLIGKLSYLNEAQKTQPRLYFWKSMRFKDRTCIELRAVHVRGSSQVPPSSKSTTQPIRPQDCHHRPTFYQPSSFHFHPASSCSVLADHDQPLWSSAALSHWGGHWQPPWAHHHHWRHLGPIMDHNRRPLAPLFVGSPSHAVAFRQGTSFPHQSVRDIYFEKSSCRQR